MTKAVSANPSSGYPVQISSTEADLQTEQLHQEAGAVQSEPLPEQLWSNSSSLKEQGKETAAFQNLTGKLRFMELNRQIQTQSNPGVPNPPSAPPPLRQSTSPGPGTSPPTTPAGIPRSGPFMLAADELLIAVEEGDTITLDYLLAKGRDINSKGNMSRTPLMFAAQLGNMKSLEFLLKNNADPNVKNIAERTALHFAAMSDNPNPKLVLRLLEAGADPNIGDNFGRTPMMLAAEKGNAEAIEVLARNGADINAVNSSGQTALMIAAENKNGFAVSELIYNGADITKADSEGETALMDAAQSGDRNVSQSIFFAVSRMDKKAKAAFVNAQDNKGRSALIHASMQGNKHEIKQLLRFHPNLNLQDNEGKTALMHAVGKGDLEAVRTLVNAGARVDIESKPGESALTMARALLAASPKNKNLQETVKVLEK